MLPSRALPLGLLAVSALVLAGCSTTGVESITSARAADGAV